MNKCVFILPYFGRFNNYFPLFLKSCSYNDSFDWLIFTDDDRSYAYPDNVRVVPMTFEEFRSLCTERFGFVLSLEHPYKLCDLKPAYGYIFESYINDYEYWGHCDCDVVFGDLGETILPLLDKGYDKLFPLGHMVIYRNDHENNRRFMHRFHGRDVYREVFTNDKICVFDEDGNPHKNPNRDNVHALFLEEGCKVDEDDPALNFETRSDRFVITRYDAPRQRWIHDDRYLRCYWDRGHIITLSVDRNTGALIRREYPYVHLQHRRMRMRSLDVDAPIIEILPDRFRQVDAIPQDRKQMRQWMLALPSRYTLDKFIDRVTGKWKSVKRKLSGMMKR